MKSILHNAIWLYRTVVALFDLPVIESIMLALSGQSAPRPIVAFCPAPTQAVTIPLPLKR